jgi:hypothetical protein
MGEWIAILAIVACIVAAVLAKWYPAFKAEVARTELYEQLDRLLLDCLTKTGAVGFVSGGVSPVALKPGEEFILERPAALFEDRAVRSYGGDYLQDWIRSTKQLLLANLWIIPSMLRMQLTLDRARFLSLFEEAQMREYSWIQRGGSSSAS